MLESLITSKTRIRILVKLFLNANNSGYLRGLALEFNESTNSVRKELNQLSSAGYLGKEKERNKVTYKANTNHPLFSSLQNMVRKYVGLDTIVATVLARMGHVSRVIVIGDYAEGLDSGLIDVVVEGKELNTVYINQMAGKIESEIDRKVNFTFTDSYQHDNGFVIYDELIDKS
ncbi:ArsR family transcriptional regulator [Formosa sediminum]|uniref:ArsR family transcriptional regulator n=1 Tax=Formosa sediminum TaxID=2594004 RepID=A0A516GQ62_9FLAO|nr:ArsR family transcriptional regulator [Formosa sediminum]QDO93668.1 ArsR family transcriptional regulator [Formosa sediminum]